MVVVCGQLGYGSGLLQACFEGFFPPEKACRRRLFGASPRF